MKTLPCLILAAAAVITAPLRAGISAPAWLETYYLDPQPNDLPPRIRELSTGGYFDAPGHAAIAIGFIGTIFAAHPDRVDGWLRQLDGLPLKTNRLLAAALWQAGHELGPDSLRILAQGSPIRAAVERVANTPPQAIADTPVHSASSMNLRWGAFLASGDAQHVIAILDSIGLNDPGLTTAATVALAQDATDHPRVLEICRAQLEREPEPIRAEMRAALDAAVNQQPRS
jgi:hypothetical protein